MPKQQDLAPSIIDLLEFNTDEITDSRWDYDIARLLEGVDAAARFGTSPISEPPHTHRVFLCHSSGDKERVKALYRRLQADGVACWLDEEDLLPGQDWEYEIGRAIRSSKYVLACLSASSITKTGYVQKEIKKALDVAAEQPEGVAYLIPVRLEDCEIPDRLRRWHWVDLFETIGYNRLLRALRSSRD